MGLLSIQPGRWRMPFYFVNGYAFPTVCDDFLINTACLNRRLFRITVTQSERFSRATMLNLYTPVIYMKSTALNGKCIPKNPVPPIFRF